ncbi:hypothetical protein [Sinorhizobium fredii]|uniref:hypothetical protein n=1 Tax=Rhizobium fredii TaxID=380 RepID=UPI00339268D4
MPKVVVYYRTNAAEPELLTASLMYQKAQVAEALKGCGYAVVAEFIEREAVGRELVAWRQAMKTVEDWGGGIDCLVVIPVTAAIGAGKPFVIPPSDRWACVFWELEFPVVPAAEVVSLPTIARPPLCLLRSAGGEAVRWHIYLCNAVEDDITDVAIEIEVYDSPLLSPAERVASVSTKTLAEIAPATCMLINTEPSAVRSDAVTLYRVTARRRDGSQITGKFSWEDMVEVAGIVT